MSRAEVKILDGAEAREISFDAFSRQPSETAANASKRLYGTSGVMPYRVVLVNGSARSAVTVDAATGDEAAEKALARHPGQKVAFVGPATKDDVYRPTDDFAGEAA